jgi:hypothetical protein
VALLAGFFFSQCTMPGLASCESTHHSAVKEAMCVDSELFHHGIPLLVWIFGEHPCSTVKALDRVAMEDGFSLRRCCTHNQ